MGRRTPGWIALRAVGSLYVRLDRSTCAPAPGRQAGPQPAAAAAGAQPHTPGGVRGPEPLHADIDFPTTPTTPANPHYPHLEREAAPVLQPQEGAVRHTSRPRAGRRLRPRPWPWSQPRPWPWPRPGLLLLLLLLLVRQRGR